MSEMDLFSRLTVLEKFSYPKFIKWGNTTIGIIQEDASVIFSSPNLNKAVQMIIGGKLAWFSFEFKQFLVDRLPSRSRRDIEKILRRCNLVEYDEMKLASVTRAINAKDLIWLAYTEEETFEEVVDKVFSNIFIKRLDLGGDSILSPEGLNIKHYGVYNGHYGLYKQRLHPFSSDVEAEVAVYGIGELLGVDCCPAWLLKENSDILSFSRFEYNFAQEYIVHARRLFVTAERKENDYLSLISVVPQFKEQVQKMVLLDFITRQTDRHLSNIALKVSASQVEFYKLYDNGRSLFYEDRGEFIEKAIKDIPLFSTEFGEVGTYFDIVQDIAKDTDISKLINLTVKEKDIRDILTNSGLSGDVLEGSFKWILGCLKILKEL